MMVVSGLGFKVLSPGPVALTLFVKKLLAVGMEVCGHHFRKSSPQVGIFISGQPFLNGTEHPEIMRHFVGLAPEHTPQSRVAHASVVSDAGHEQL